MSPFYGDINVVPINAILRDNVVICALLCWSIFAKHSAGEIQHLKKGPLNQLGKIVSLMRTEKTQVN